MNFLCGGRFKIPANLAGGGLEPPAWVKDSDAPACGVCKEGFMMGWGKHHCRCCGGVACDGCSRDRRTLLKFGFTTPVRVCKTCNSKCFDADLLLNAVGHMDLSAAEKLLHQGVGYNGDPKPGVDPSFTTTMFPALVVAANRGSAQMVALLLEHKADPNPSRGYPGGMEGGANTATQCFKCGMTQAGVQTGAVARCNRCAEPIHASPATPAPEAGSDHVGISPLHAAVQVNGFIDVVTLLLDSNADVSAATAQGNTPLHYAAAGGHAECCGAILSCGADSNVRSLDGDSPLHKAARGGHEEAVRVLLRGGADRQSRNAGGLSPRGVAGKSGHDSLLALLDPDPFLKDGEEAYAEQDSITSSPQILSRLSSAARSPLRSPNRSPFRATAYDSPIASGARHRMLEQSPFVSREKPMPDIDLG